MIVDIVDKYCTDDNNPIKNLRLKLPAPGCFSTYMYINFLSLAASPHI